MNIVILDGVLFIASVLLIIGLRKLSNPDSASNGNSLAAVALGLGSLSLGNPKQQLLIHCHWNLYWGSYRNYIGKKSCNDRHA